MSYVAARPAVGALLRDWRQRRRMTQMDLALEADVSARHLSFIETGRSTPSAEMIKHLAEQLDVPLRERNELLLAGGYAPAYGQRDLDEPEMGAVREALHRVLAGHEPFPAGVVDRPRGVGAPARGPAGGGPAGAGRSAGVVIDRHGGMVAGNSAVGLLTAGVAPHLLEPPVNVLRVTLHPQGMAPRIRNLGEWRAHLLDRLGRQAVVTGDPALFAPHAELAAHPGGEPGHVPDPEAGGIAVPLRLAAGDAELAFIGTATTFGTATDVTVSELAIESFFPADEATARALRARPRGG